MKHSRYTRRRLLQGLGGTAALLPFLPVLESEAGGAAPPRRLVIFWTPNGLYRDALRPGAPGALNVNASPTLQPLASHADKMLFMEGVDFAAHLEFAGGNGGNHHPGHVMCMTGTTANSSIGTSSGQTRADGPSLDHFIADRLPSGATPFRSLNIGVGPESSNMGYGRIFWRSAGQSAVSEDNPTTVFTSLFGEMGAEEAVVEAQRRRRLDVLHSVNDRLTVVRSRLGAPDRHKFDAHLQAIEELQGQLHAPNCAAPPMDAATSYEADGHNQVDIVAAALSCDLTRVVALQWDRAASFQVFPGISSKPHHEINHFQSNGLTEDEAFGLATQIDTWYANMLARLCDKLAAIEEGGGSVLDNTTILWCSDHGWPRGHERRDMPYVIMGRGGGYFDTGRYVRYDGASNNDLYISVCHAMGLDDVTVFGHPDLCAGPLSGLSA